MSNKKRNIILLASMLLVSIGNGIPVVVRVAAGDDALEYPFLVFHAIVSIICLVLAMLILLWISYKATKIE